MGKIELVSKSRKAYECSKCHAVIPAGSSYYRGTVFRQRTPVIRCRKCGLKGYEVSNSDYAKSIGPIVEDWQTNYGISDGVWDAIIDDLQSVLDDVQERLENIPEQLQEGSAGSILQERIDQLESAIYELDFDFDDLLDESFSNLDVEEQERIDKLREKMNGVSLSELYSQMEDADGTGNIFKDFESWKEETESVITEHIDEILSELSY